jgi:serine/threonine protein kinase
MFQVSRGEWPPAVEEKYERYEALGKGSFGMVWMCRRVVKSENEFDDEFVAIKNIVIKNEKSKVYAEREICILQELKHPSVIRLISAYPEHSGTRVVVMQLARGPNLHQLVVKRGALGLPLCRLISRQLIGAVSYIHGRAVIHRDIKPSNCILACLETPLTDEYDWYDDDLIWCNDKDAEEAVTRNKWKLMLVDFGFARALEMDEISTQNRHMRNSIIFEHNKAAKGKHSKSNGKQITNGKGNNGTIPETESENDESSNHNTNGKDDDDDDDDSGASLEADMAHLEKMVSSAAESLRKSTYLPTNPEEDDAKRIRKSGISEAIPQKNKVERKSGIGAGRKSVKGVDRRMSTARHKVRSMSALGTKAYAAPEIRKKLRQKTEQDVDKANAAMTECVADYGMIVDAYSVGWTLRVTMTGVPPNFTISEYMQERESVVMEGDEDERPGGCCLCSVSDMEIVKIRDPSMLPHAATLLLTKLTEKQPEDRMTVREAQIHPYIAGSSVEEKYVPIQGDYPSLHGDPVVPLNCAEELSKLTVRYHMQ